MKMKLNEPLQNMADELLTTQEFGWASDKSRVKFSLEREELHLGWSWGGLDLSETPFFTI